jgi:hypothetical protein
MVSSQTSLLVDYISSRRVQVSIRTKSGRVVEDVNFRGKVTLRVAAKRIKANSLGNARDEPTKLNHGKDKCREHQKEKVNVG